MQVSAPSKICYRDLEINTQSKYYKTRKFRAKVTLKRKSSYVRIEQCGSGTQWWYQTEVMGVAGTDISEFVISG